MLTLLLLLCARVAPTAAGAAASGGGVRARLHAARTSPQKRGKLKTRTTTPHNQNNNYSSLKVHDRRIRKARAKQNLALAKRLLAAKPGYKLDHLVKER